MTLASNRSLHFIGFISAFYITLASYQPLVSLWPCISPLYYNGLVSVSCISLALCLPFVLHRFRISLLYYIGLVLVSGVLQRQSWDIISPLTLRLAVLNRTTIDKHCCVMPLRLLALSLPLRLLMLQDLVVRLPLLSGDDCSSGGWLQTSLETHWSAWR